MIAPPPVARRAPLIPRVFLPLALTALAAAACGGERPATGTGDTGGTVVVAVSAEPLTLLPPLVNNVQEQMVTELLFSRLAEIGDGLETYGDRGFTPSAARSWTWAPDSLAIAFTLDSTARWHDGVPVTARDVAFTFAAYTSDVVGAPQASQLRSIDSVTARDARTAVFWFRARSPHQFFDATYPMQLLPAHRLDTIPLPRLAQAPEARTPVGSGPFRFVRWDAGARVEVVADTAHWRGRPPLDRVVFAVTPDADAALVRLLAGDVDVVEGLTAEQLPRVAGAAAVRVEAVPSLQYGYLTLNWRDPQRPDRPHPLLGDVRVRQALQRAVDRGALARNVFDSLAAVGVGPAPSALLPAELGDPTPAVAVAAANALLDSAGWTARAPDGTRLKDGRPLALDVLVPAPSRSRQRYAVLLQAQLAAVGVRLVPQVLEVSALVARLEARRFDTFLGVNAADPGLLGLRQSWRSDGPSNDGRYASAAFDAQVDSALGAFDPATGRRHMVAAMRQAAADVPALFLFEPRVLLGVHRRLRTPSLPATGWVHRLAAWSVDPAARLPRDGIGVAPAPEGPR
jgi:peptide/nickel transport system substrate-binding protein